MSQITLLTGPERRRRWSDEEKLSILEEAFAPGSCVSDVARRHDVAPGLIYTWRRNARAATHVGSGFVEAVVTDPGSSADPGCRPVIQVELASARVSIAAAASPGLVGAVLRALR
jgi:transposase